MLYTTIRPFVAIKLQFCAQIAKIQLLKNLKIYFKFFSPTIYGEVLMAYSRGAIANVCMLSKSDWRVGPATFPYTFTHSAHDTVSSQLMHCYIRVRALLLYILYALCFGKIYISTVCTEKISGPPSKASPIIS